MLYCGSGSKSIGHKDSHLIGIASLQNIAYLKNKNLASKTKNWLNFVQLS
jgi:hypothetical protein